MTPSTKKDGCLFQIRRHGSGSLGDSEENEQWAMQNGVEKVSVYPPHFSKFVPDEPPVSSWWYYDDKEES
jgi:hypothetical protein